MTSIRFISQTSFYRFIASINKQLNEVHLCLPPFRAHKPAPTYIFTVGTSLHFPSYGPHTDSPLVCGSTILKRRQSFYPHAAYPLLFVAGRGEAQCFLPKLLPRGIQMRLRPQPFFPLFLSLPVGDQPVSTVTVEEELWTDGLMDMTDTNTQPSTCTDMRALTYCPILTHTHTHTLHMHACMHALARTRPLAHILHNITQNCFMSTSTLSSHLCRSLPFRLLPSGSVTKIVYPCLQSFCLIYIVLLLLHLL
jgi:hypothetical protein